MGGFPIGRVILPFNSSKFQLKQKKGKQHNYVTSFVSSLTQKKFSIGQHITCPNSKMNYVYNFLMQQTQQLSKGKRETKAIQADECKLISNYGKKLSFI